jgi:hypothetical protein
MMRFPDGRPLAACGLAKKVWLWALTPAPMPLL